MKIIISYLIRLGNIKIDMQTKNKEIKRMFMIMLPDSPRSKLQEQGLRYKISIWIGSYIFEMGPLISIIYLLIT